MIRMTSFAEKSDQAWLLFVLKRSLRRFSPGLRDGDPFLFLSIGAEAPAYFLSVPPRRRCRASIYVLSPKFMADVWRLACSLNVSNAIDTG
jgi:hypothetical protein